MSPKVSVLMTVYNGGSFLEKTLDFILSQTFADFELIVIDDGSTDNTWEMLSAYARRDARVALRRNSPNQGVTAAMNSIFPLAKGDYVVRHDADDLSSPDRLAAQVDFLEAHPEVGLVGSWVENIAADGGPFRPRTFFPLESDNDTIQRQLYEGNCLGQGAVMFRRALLDRVGLYDKTVEYCEDYDLWLRMAEITQVAKVPQFLYQYRQHASTRSTLHHGKQMLHMADSLEKALRRRFPAGAPDMHLRQAARHFVTAATVFLSAGDLEGAAHCLAKAIRQCPEAFAMGDIETPMKLDAKGQQLTDLVFKQLPRTLYFARLKARYVSRLYMQEVFAAFGQDDFERIDSSMWPGLKHNPGWLLNRGVLSILRKSLLRRIDRKLHPIQ